LLDQLDATIMIYWWTNNSTCFGHHYAHLQECKAVHYSIWFTTLHSRRWAQWCPKHVELLLYQ